MDCKHYEIIWNDINITITHTPDKWGMEHIEIRSIKPKNAALPITETGYKSQFLYKEYLEPYGSPADYVLDWLEHEAKSPGWKAKCEVKRQYSLF